MNHAFMPIAIRAVSRQEFETWVSGQRVAAAPEGGKAEAGAKAPSASKTPRAPPAAPAPSQRTLSGSNALTLAALVAQYSPLVPKTTKRALSNLENKIIAVEAGSIDCGVSTGGTAIYGCGLKFGTRAVLIKGRKAHELLATLSEAGTESRQEAGMLHHAIDHLSCEIVPSEIQRKADGGSECRFELGSH